MPVKAGQYHDFLLGHHVEHAIRETAKQGAAYVAVDGCEGERIALDCLETLTECLNELVTKVVTSFSVPRENSLDVRLCRGREAKDHFLRANESRTCDQGRAACGFLR